MPSRRYASRAPCPPSRISFQPCCCPSTGIENAGGPFVVTPGLSAVSLRTEPAESHWVAQIWRFGRPSDHRVMVAFGIDVLKRSRLLGCFCRFPPRAMLGPHGGGADHWGTYRDDTI